MEKPHKTYPAQEKGRFKNYPGEPNHNWIDIAALFWRACKLYIARKKYTSLTLPPNWIKDLSLSINEAIATGKEKIWWLGHATFLIYQERKWIMTDPVFGDLSSLFPRLFSTTNLAQILPPIDAILISHNHYDHLDKKSIQQLITRNPAAEILVPQGNLNLCRQWGAQNVTQYSWWEHKTLTNGLKAIFVPAKHWSRRTLFDTNRSLWGGWVIQNPSHAIYFAGDTAMGDHFSEIQANINNITYALLPIGPCKPEHENRPSHLDPIQAAQAFSLLKAETMIPCHWGTYPLGIDQPTVPLDLLRHWWSNQTYLAPEQCAWLLPGQSIAIQPKIAASKPQQTTTPERRA